MTGSHIVALVVLPQRYNPDAKSKRKGVEDAKFKKSMAEIAAQFGGGVLWEFGSEAPTRFLVGPRRVI